MPDSGTEQPYRTIPVNWKGRMENKLNPFACTLSMWKKCTFDKFLFTGRNFFAMQNCKQQPIYILTESFTHFPTRPSSSILKNEMLTKLWLKVWSSVARSFVDPEKRFRNLFHSEQLEKLNSLSGLQHDGEMGIMFSQWNRFPWLRFSKIHNVPGEWLSIIVAHAAWVPVNSVSATKASSSTLCSTSASPNPSPNGPSCSKDSFFTSSMSSSSPKLREHLFLYVHLQERTPDHHLRHPRRQGLPIARFCFALALCAANFKPTITWKRNGTAIVVGDHSSVVKRSSFSSRKSSYFKAASASLWLSVTSRWERETAHFWAKISARTWTWTPQNDLITVKNNSLRSFMRNLVAMRQMKTKLRCLKPHRPYTVDFAIDARERV